MTIHDNQLLLLPTAEIDEIAAQAIQDDELAPVFELISLRAIHQGEFSTAQDMRALENKTWGKLNDLLESQQATQKVHDVLWEKIVTTENRNIEAAMNAKGIEEVRAANGDKTRVVVRRYVVELLKQKPEYQQWLADLGELQGELDAFPGAIEKLDTRIKIERARANAQFLKAGDLLIAIQEREALLNA